LIIQISKEKSLIIQIADLHMKQLTPKSKQNLAGSLCNTLQVYQQLQLPILC